MTWLSIVYLIYIVWSAAPSAPRSVRARLVSPRQSVVEVRWRQPAVTNGIISQYTVLVSERAGTVGDGGALSINRANTFNIVWTIFLTFSYHFSLPLLLYYSHRISCNRFPPCRHIKVTLVLPTLLCAILNSITHFRWGLQTWWTDFRTMVTFLKSQWNQQCLSQAEVCYVALGSFIRDTFVTCLVKCGIDKMFTSLSAR